MNNYSSVNYKTESFIDKLRNNKKTEPINKISSKNQTQKETVNVGIYVEPPFISINDKGELYGFNYNLWSLIKNKLKNKYHFNEKIYYHKDTGNHKTIGFKEFTNNLGKEYDIMVYPIYPSKERANKMNFSVPIGYDPMVIIHHPIVAIWNALWKYVIHTVIPFIILILILGIIFGQLLYFFDKKRGHKRAILTTIASFFGEAGFLSERWGPDNTTFKKLHLQGIPMIILLFVLTYFFSLIMQAFTTTQAINIFNSRKMDITNLQGKTFAAPQGFVSSASEAVIAAGAQVKPLRGSISEKLKQISGKKFDGLILGKQKTDYLLKSPAFSNKNWETTSLAGLSLSPNTLAIAKGKHPLLEDINNTILHLQDTRKLWDYCKANFEPKDRFMCAI